MAARLKFAREHRAWTVEDWRKVVWTDETSVSTAGNSATVWVFRKPGERLHPSCVIPTYKSGHVTVMMWGAFQGNKRGPLARCPDGRINSEKYIELLTEKGLPWFRTLGEGALWMQDNATVHTSRRTTRFLRDNGLEPIKWPPQSPDLNPIENLWFVLKAKLQKKNSTHVNPSWRACCRQGHPRGLPRADLGGDWGGSAREVCVLNAGEDGGGATGEGELDQILTLKKFPLLLHNHVLPMPLYQSHLWTCLLCLHSRGAVCMLKSRSWKCGVAKFSDWTNFLHIAVLSYHISDELGH